MDRDAGIQVFGLAEILRVLRRRWRWVVCPVLVLVALTLALSLSRTKQYSATAKVLLNPPTDVGLSTDSVQANVPQIADRLLSNELQVIGSNEMHAAVEKEYSGKLDVSDVEASVAAVGSDAVQITAKGSDPKDVANLANIYASTYIDFSQSARVKAITEYSTKLADLQNGLRERREQLLAPLADLDGRIARGESGLQGQRAALAADLQPQVEALDNQAGVYTAQQENLKLAGNVLQVGAPQLIGTATVPTDPDSPKPVRDGIIGLMLGVAVGLALALAREFLDQTINTAEDLERVLRDAYPILTIVPEVEDGLRSSFNSTLSQTPAAEAYRTLRTAVRFAQLERPMQVLQVTSASPSEGKTTTAANLATALHQAGHQVTMACCDLRRPSIQDWFGVTVSPGLTDVLLGEQTLQTALRQVGPHLFLLPAGTPPHNPSELLGTQRAEQVISALVPEMDFVVIDTTPVLPVTDAIVVSRFVDATIVVVCAGSTSRDELRRTLTMLEQASAPILGVVFNRASVGDRNSYGYSYGDSYVPKQPQKAPAGREPVASR